MKLWCERPDVRSEIVENEWSLGGILPPSAEPYWSIYYVPGATRSGRSPSTQGQSVEQVALRASLPFSSQPSGIARSSWPWIQAQEDLC